METIVGSRKGILVGGNWIVDHVKIVDTYPAQDTLANIISEERGTGGAPYNMALNLAKLGAKFPIAGVGLIGDDPDGAAILSDCRKHRVDPSGIITLNGAHTSYTDVMTVKSTGRRTFYHYRGANRVLSEKHFDLEKSSAAILLLGYLLLLDGMDAVAGDGTTGASRLLARAKKLGFKTAIDLVSEDSNRFTSVVSPALPYVDYLFLNEIEASRTTGIEVGSHGKVSFAQLSKAAAKLIEMGVNELVIIHCVQGALARSRDGAEVVHGSVDIPAAEISGTAGAGDAFAAGMLMGLCENLPLSDCLRFAACAAAACLTHSTCTGGMQTLTECLKLGDRMGYRSVG